MINQRLKTVLVVVGFSVLAEYSLRGFHHLLEQPGLAFIIFLNYLFYFLLLEDLIGRYRLRAFQLYLIAFVFGVYWQVIGVPVAIIPNPPPLPKYVFGFNVYGIFYNDFIVWPLLQSVFAFYLATRLFPRPQAKALFPVWGVIVSIIGFSLVTFSFRVFVPNFPVPSVYQFSVMVLMILVALVGFAVSVQKNKFTSETPAIPRRDRILDWLGIGVVGIMFYMAFLLPYSNTSKLGPAVLNVKAVPLFLLYTFVTASIILFRAIIMRRQISV